MRSGWLIFDISFHVPAGIQLLPSEYGMDERKEAFFSTAMFPLSNLQREIVRGAWKRSGPNFAGETVYQKIRSAG